MARTFTITCAAGTIHLAGDARGECSFTVTNTAAAAVSAHPAVVALDGRATAWFAVVGEPVRQIGPGQTIQVTVTISPSGAPAGRYGFRLDVLPAEGGERSAGPEVFVELSSEAPPPLPGSRAFPWWWLVLAVVLLAVVAVVLWLVLGRERAPAEEPDGTAATAVSADGAKPGAAEVEALVKRWLVAFDKEDAAALTALTSTPALIVGGRADDARTVLKLYTGLLSSSRSSPTRLTAPGAAGKPLLARVRDVRAGLPPEAGAIGLDDDDHAVGVTPRSGPGLVLLIRHGPPPRIAGVAR